MKKIETRIIFSIIIPTYNRCLSLKRALDSLKLVNYPSNQLEIVIVDNNSTDNTREIAEKFQKKSKIKIIYTIENKLSFTVARHKGSEIAKGKILIYIDDDVTVKKNWLKFIEHGFKNKNVGMVGGPIKPVYESNPPKWVLDMNGIWLSLYDLGGKVQYVDRIPGPNLSIRKTILKEVGGFPPDTIGVEAEGKPRVVEKIYVGSGDWGLCDKVTKAGYKIIYQPKALVYHHIPPLRLTKKWWQSRFFGEGCCHVIMDQHKNNFSRIIILTKFIGAIIQILKWLLILFVSQIFNIKRREIHRYWLWFYYAQLKIWLGIIYYPDLAEKLWDFGLKGVLPQQQDRLKKYYRWIG